MQPAIFNFNISVAVEVNITPKPKWCNRVSKDAFVEA
jgi:hypothetical protein